MKMEITESLTELKEENEKLNQRLKRYELFEINIKAGMPENEASFQSGYTCGHDTGYEKGKQEGADSKSVPVNAKYICTFRTFQQWVNKASSWLGGNKFREGTLICIDTAGNICLIGEDFMAARDFGLFPVKAYRMIKTIEAV